MAIHVLVKKKKHTYTVIQYEDGSENKEKGEVFRNLGSTNVPNLIQYRQAGDKITVVLDFKEDIYRIQSLMHDKIMESKHNDNN